MDPTDDTLLGQIAQRRALVTPAQIEACLAEQDAVARRGAVPPPIGALFVQRKLVTPALLQELVAAQEFLREGQPGGAHRRTEDASFGERLIAQGLAARDQIDHALRAQARLAERGIRLRLGEILVGRGVLTRAQVREVLAEQDKTVLRCADCRMNFNVRDFAPDREVVCPVCGKPLTPPASFGDVRVVGTAAALPALEARAGTMVPVDVPAGLRP
ncbi:MAG: hypothetical protein HZA54_08555, partial [Planctomycetes bacterium]|nr:hypothetical protein [Planctomycetota bacterium]